jgi:hypothetical protein
MNHKPELERAFPNTQERASGPPERNAGALRNYDY